MRSVLREEGITDLFAQVSKDIADRATEKSKTGRNYYLGGSISKYTKGLLMSFPVLCDDVLSIDSVTTISKANEKNITSMMEMLFASISINGKMGMTGKEVVNLFHRNIDTIPIDDYIDMADNYVTDYLRSEAGELLPRVKDSVVREAARDMVEQLKLPKKSFPVNSFSETSINDYMTKDNSGKVFVYEDRINSTPKIYDPTMDVTDREKFNYQRGQDTIRNTQADRKLDQQQSRDDYQRGQDARNNPYAVSQYTDSRGRARAYMPQSGTSRDNMYNQNKFNQKRAIDSDYKKANELQPTMLVVNFNVLDDEKKNVIDRSSFVAGIKCRIIPTTSSDIAERLISVNKQKLSFKNLIRATTGEISFTKDFLLAIKQQKIDAKNDAKRGEAARLWNTLKKRSIHNNYRRMSKDGNDASAITTLVVSQDTANFLNATNKIDILSPKIAKGIMDSYNLLCLIIADDANEVAYFMYDGNKNFEKLAYAVLSKEANDKALKRELNLIQQARRF